MSRWVRNRSGLIIPNREAGFIQPGIGLMNKKQGGGGGDPYWNSVTSLIHFDDVGGGIVDERGLNWSMFGTASLTANPVKFGSGALQMLVSLGGATVPTGSAFNVAALDWTLELFLYYISDNGVGRIFSVNGDSYNFIGLSATNGNLSVVASSTGSSWNVVLIAPTATVIPKNVWSHIAACRYGNSIITFVNGIIASNSNIGTTSLYTNPNGMCIGGQSTGPDRHLVGSMDEFRFTLGHARYTANFTPPTAPFPNHS